MRSVLAVVLLLLFIDRCCYGTPFERAVCVARHGESAKVRHDACMHIAELGGSDAVDVLVGFLDDDVLWSCAAIGLGELRDPRGVGPLLDRARHGGEHADLMVRALGEIGDSQVLSTLREMNRSLEPRAEQDQRLKLSLEEAIAKVERSTAR